MPKIQVENEFELAKFHLERFWKEIFWRRENEQKITVWSLGLFGVLIALVYGKNTGLELLQKLLLSSFPLMLGFIGCWYLHQNWKKAQQIARIIVSLNDSLGAWEKKLIVNSGTLYPEKWKTWGKKRFRDDKVSFCYTCFVAISAFLTILAIIKVDP